MGNFPDIPKSISDYLYEEEGNITRNKLLMIGSMAVIMSVLFALEADAGHGSHKSHKSHNSHSSGVRANTNSTQGIISHSNNSNGTAYHINSIKRGQHHSHSSRHNSRAHGSHQSHVSGSTPSHTNTTPPAHSNHSSHSNNLPRVLTPQKSANASLPESVDLIKIPSIPNLPDTATPAFSTSILSAPTETSQE